MAAVLEHVEERLREVELVAQRSSDRIGSHEELCAERYKTINISIADVKSSNEKTNRYLLAIGGFILAALAKLVFFS